MTYCVISLVRGKKKSSNSFDKFEITAFLIMNFHIDLLNNFEFLICIYSLLFF